MMTSIRKTLPALCVALAAAAFGAMAPNDAHAQSGFAVGYITGVPMGGAGGAIGAQLHQSVMMAQRAQAEANAETPQNAVAPVMSASTAPEERNLGVLYGGIFLVAIAYAAWLFFFE